MPTYDYRCEECGNEFEEMLTIARRKEPTESPCECGGEINQVVGLTGFAYDNIKAGKSAKAKKPPGWIKHKLKEITRQQPGATMGLPF